MKIKDIIYSTAIAILSVFVFGSCQDGFLDKKPSTNLIVPTTLDDFQRLMDDGVYLSRIPDLGELSADNYFMPNIAAVQSSETIQARNAYTFKSDIYEGQNPIGDWNAPYRQVFVANVVLEGLEKLDTNNEQEQNTMKGWALFMRAHAFFNLSQLFCSVYDPATAQSDLGIPLRLKAGVDEKSVRSSLQETYDRIIQDLNEAAELLPAQLPAENRNRPSKSAALGLLARVFLNMRDYETAQNYASECLKVSDALLDFNTVANISTPLEYNHAECLYWSKLGDIIIFNSRFGRNSLIDTVFYNSYNDGDLRKIFFYKPSANYPQYYMLNKSYTGSNEAFGGIATDEIYLIEAECLARTNHFEESMDVLNQLLINRYSTESFVPVTANSDSEALSIVLNERRKELAFRGLRWQDLRRLNKEGYNITVRRNLEGTNYTLPPNSPLYVFPIPADEIRLSGIQQNLPR